MYTIGEICKRFNLSRSTILYYDKLGLLKATKRQANNYRVYNEEQVTRLENILIYRNFGVSLKDIGKILDPSNSEVSTILLNRLSEIQSEIEVLKKQRLFVIDVLKQEIIYKPDTQFTPKTWSELLLKLGYDEPSTFRWHKEFEEENPKMHRKFLKSLNMSNKEIEKLILKIKGL